MASLLIKDVPSILHRKLKDRAVRHHRSMNKEVIAILEATLETGHRPGLPDLPDPIPINAPITARMLRDAKREGRA
ncbi:MAG: Arc family DNA-binding protein [Rhodothermia bacterium]